MTTIAPGYWRPGDDPGERKFVTVHGESGSGFTFEGRGHLAAVTVAYETWGTLNAERSNAVLVLHALSADSHAVGDVGPSHRAPGWWNGLIGPGLALDTNEFFVVCPNVLGGAQGTTGPSSLDADGRPYGSRFPVITVRDQVTVEVALADALELATWHAVVGGSMGGMRVLEWAVGYPTRVRRAVVLAVGAASTADQIAQSSFQVRAIRADPHFLGGDYYDSGTSPDEGLAIARGLGHITYRSSSEFDARFGRSNQDETDPLHGGLYAIESYLAYQGEKLVRRFDANSYVVLSEAMNHHDVGRGRGGVAAALATIESQVTVIGIDSDRLYPLRLQEEIVRLTPGAQPLFVISSPVGHDGFLLEVDQIGKIVHGALHE
ncbi:MAG TPA: homoserine O-acetyltransferase [Acidimicrobiales bacterium]|nr:homoserine O-acetyltransferase [Acidimicrobiales bacterium]